MSVLWGAGGAVLASLAFAPLLTTGWCADAHPPGQSICSSRTTSALGFSTSVELWIGALIVVAAVTAVAAVVAWRRAASD